MDTFSRTHGNTPVRVLIVDDELLIRWSLRETLAERGFTVSDVGDAGSALAAVAAERPDVVLLDLRLPDSEDLGLLASIRQLAPLCQVILMTAFGTVEAIDGAMRLGAFRVVTKPFDLAEMASLVRKAHAAAIRRDG
jgi:DNA-binding NtrC family response regulator